MLAGHVPQRVGLRLYKPCPAPPAVISAPLKSLYTVMTPQKVRHLSGLLRGAARDPAGAVDSPPHSPFLCALRDSTLGGKQYEPSHEEAKTWERKRQPDDHSVPGGRPDG